MNCVDVLILEILSLAKRGRLARLAKGLRQVDLASMAQLSPITIFTSNGTAMSIDGSFTASWLYQSWSADRDSC